ncbi:MAG: hypothetical protein WBR26_05580 [Candidatus Acidiferrum sp.]
MGTQAKMESDPLELLKVTLEDTPRGRTLLGEYVRELELYRQEEDTFLRLAFRDARYGGAGAGPFVVSIVSQLYEPLGPGQKLEVRRWWHDKIRREAERFSDLKERIAKIRS